MEKQLNIPNVISMFRLLTVPGIFLLIVNSNAQNYVYLILLYSVSALLDFFDGYFARKLNQETELGKILDPLADKLLVLATVVALIIKSDFPLWFGIVIISRDLLIGIVGSFLLRGKKKVLPSILIGKVTFAAIGVLLLVYIIDLHPSADLLVLKRFFIVSTVCFLVWSMAGYYEIYKREKHA